MSDYSAVAPPPNFSQSVAFAAALQRAKQIAAKINPTNASNPDIKLKRSLEDSQEPDTKKLAVDPLLGLRQSGLGDSHGGRGLSQSSSPPQLGGGGGGGGSGGSGGGGLGGICNEDIRVPDKMVGLIIGRGGEQITRLQSETGCKIQMAPESGGLPDRVCTLTGSREAVNRAKERVLSIVNDRCRAEGLGETGMGGGSNSSGSIGGGSIGGGSGPMMSSGHGGGGGGGGGGSVEIMIPGPKVGLIIGKGGETIKQLQEKSGAKMIVIQDGPSLQEQEKPLRITGDPQKVEYAKNLVYELIAEKEMQMFQRGPRTNNERSSSFSSDNGFGHGGSGGGGGGGGGSSPDGVEVLVPRAAVGVVIGKGGDMIKKIQSETGARVQFQQGREEGPGDRKCLLSGKPQAVEQARQRIQELIDSVIRRDDRNPMGGGRGGGGGSTGNGNGSRGNGFGGSAGRPNEYGGWDRRSSGGSMENKIETTYKVPSTKCGIIIGKGGETIKQINQQTGAHCELDRNNQEFENEKVFFIRGSPEQVEHAKRIFSEKLGGGGGGMGSSGGSYTPGGQGGPIGYNPTWNPNSGYQSWPNTGQQSDANNTAQSVQMNPQTGQPDYSAQWAEYYRSMGMHREAEMIEQQSKQAKTDQQPAPPGSAGAAAAAAQQQQQQQQQAQAQAQASQQGQQTAATQNGGQPDYSAQWAEYYRSIGKPKEAEAIEAQMKGGKMNMPSNQMAQPQMQQQQQQPGSNSAAPGTPSPFPQAYGTYPGMNPGAPGYYPSGGGGGGGGSGSGGGGGSGGNSGSGNTPTQQQSGQQNPGFGGGMGYQNYPYSQQNSDN